MQLGDYSSACIKIHLRHGHWWLTPRPVTRNQEQRQLFIGPHKAKAIRGKEFHSGPYFLCDGALHVRGQKRGHTIGLGAADLKYEGG